MPRPTRDMRPFEFLTDHELHIVELGLRRLGQTENENLPLAEYSDLERQLLLVQAEQEKLRREKT